MKRLIFPEGPKSIFLQAPNPMYLNLWGILNLEKNHIYPPSLFDDLLVMYLRFDDYGLEQHKIKLLHNRVCCRDNTKETRNSACNKYIPGSRFTFIP